MKKLRFLPILLILSWFNISAQNLNPGDGIRITLYNVPESVSGDYFIQDNGRIQLPYLGMLDTQNKDFTDLRNEIVVGYSKIYRDPELSVQALYRIEIFGEVGKPGVYYLNGYEKVSDLLSIAGGETSDSNIDELKLIRENTQMEIDLGSFIEGDNSLVDIGIQSGDKIYVPRKWLVGIRDASVIVSGVAVLVALVSLFRK